MLEHYIVFRGRELRERQALLDGQSVEIPASAEVASITIDSSDINALIYLLTQALCGVYSPAVSGSRWLT